MDVTAKSVVEYLISRELLAERDIVMDGLRVDEVAGRNRNFIAVLEDGHGYFLKHARRGDPNLGAFLEVEAEVYRRARDSPPYAPLSKVLPGFCLYDPDRHILVLDYVEARYAPEQTDSTMGLSPIAGVLGRALASGHKVSDDGSLGGLLAPDQPWILSLPRPVPAMLRELSPAQAETIRLVQQRPGMCAVLDELREGWSGTNVIHRDIKWANIIVHEDPAGAPTLKIVDWELAAIGDVAWDVGSVFHAYLAHCVLDLDLPEDATSDEAAALFGSRLPTIQGEHRAFWKAYASEARLIDEIQFLRRATLYCGARLLQSAYEWGQAEANMSRAAVAALQLAANMLTHPGDALTSVLGLEAPRAPTVQ